MTKEVTPEVAERVLTPFEADMQRILRDVSRNPAQVEFPRDQYGMTTAMRKHGLAAAGSIRGNEEKLAVYIGTLQVLAQHVKARFEDDKVVVQNRRANAQRLVERERAIGLNVGAPTTEPAVPVA